MNMKKIILLSALLLINSAFPQNINVPAAIKSLTEQSFVKYPKVSAMKDVIRISELKIDMTQAAYLPIVNGDVSYRWTDPVSEMSLPLGVNKIVTFQIMPKNNYNAGITLAQSIIDLKTPANINKAKSDLLTANDNLDNYKIQLAYQIAQVYYGIIFLNKSLYVQQKQLDLISSNIRQIESKIKNGDALKYDLVTSQVRYSNVENAYTELQNQANKQYNVLNMLTANEGSDYIKDTAFSQNDFNILPGAIMNLARENNLDLKITKDKIETAAWDVTITERSYLPTLNFNAGAGYKNGYSPDLDQFRFNYSVGVGLTIPIMSASRPGIQKEIALVNIESSKKELENQNITVAKDVLNAIEDMRKNEKKLANVEVLLNQAQLALDLATERYKNGVITNLDLLTAQTNYLDAQLNKLQYEYNILISKIELNRLSSQKWW
jgi:outer membrane protein